MIIKLRNGCLVLGTSKSLETLREDYYNAYLAYKEYFPEESRRCKADCIRLYGKLENRGMYDGKTV